VEKLGINYPEKNWGGAVPPGPNIEPPLHISQFSDNDDESGMITSRQSSGDLTSRQSSGDLTACLSLQTQDQGPRQ